MNHEIKDQGVEDELHRRSRFDRLIQRKTPYVSY